MDVPGTERDKIIKLRRMLDKSAYAVFFGGAGVSTESGVPDFRSAGGIYRNSPEAESILTPEYLLKDPKRFYQFYRRYFILDGIIPNAAHRILAKLESTGVIKAVITQNVDGLHQKAGSRNVIELHGTGSSFHCLACECTYPLSYVKQAASVPLCTCGGMLRPDIVLYGESLRPVDIDSAIDSIKRSDLLIIGGTSLAVYPAAGLLAYQPRNGKRVVVNLTGSETHADIMITRPIGEVFQELETLPDSYPADPPGQKNL